MLYQRICACVSSYLLVCLEIELSFKVFVAKCLTFSSCFQAVRKAEEVSDSDPVPPADDSVDMDVEDGAKSSDVSILGRLTRS